MTLDDIRALSDEGLIDLLADTATLGMKFVTKHEPPNYQHFLADEERRLKSLVKKYFMAEGGG